MLPPALCVFDFFFCRVSMWVKVHTKRRYSSIWVLLTSDSTALATHERPPRARSLFLSIDCGSSLIVPARMHPFIETP